MTTSPPLLLVEDSKDDIVLMKLALKKAGIKNPLHIVNDGPEAIEYVTGSGAFADRENYPLPALIFLDLKLPLMSGHEVLMWIRKRDHLSSTVIVVLTASENPEDLRRASRLGAHSYLVKPSTAQELADQLLEMAKAFNWHWLGCGEFAPA